MNPLGLELARPWALLGLGLPLLLLLLARLPGRPTRLATGTLELWRQVAVARARAAAGPRPRIPPSIWLLALALASAVVALAGPRPLAPPLAREWRFVVDRGPSLYLPGGRAHFEEPFDAKLPATAGAPRLELALERASREARRHLAAGDRVRWSDPSAAGAPSHPGEQAPRAWLEPPPIPRAAPDWARFDAPGVIWVTDRAPQGPRAHAGLIAAGGPPVPGPVAALGTTRLDWDGARLVEVEGGLPQGSLGLDPRLPPELVELAGYYADSRGLARDGPGPRALELRFAGEGPDVALRAGRDGFGILGWAAASGTPAHHGEEPQRVELVPWLLGDPREEPRGIEPGASSALGLPLISAGPGVVAVALRRIEALYGDPAALPVAFARLLDGHALAAPGLVSLERRGSAGAARFEPPREPPPTQAAPDEPPWIALLVLLALGAALVGLHGLRWGPRAQARPNSPSSGP